MTSAIHIGHIVQEELRAQERSVSWFARQLGASRMTCYRIFHSYSIDTQLLYHISEVLERDFFVEYSEKLVLNKTM